jgi:hypothetical protein
MKRVGHRDSIDNHVKEKIKEAGPTQKADRTVILFSVTTTARAREELFYAHCRLGSSIILF